MQFISSKFSRRSFLGASAAGMAGLALSRMRAFGEDTLAVAHDFGGLPVGIQSYTLRSMSFERALDTVKNDLKLTNIEIWNGHHPGLSPTKVKSLVADHGLTATAWGVVAFGTNADENRRTFEAAKEIGVTRITCDPDPASLDNLDKLTEEFGITADIHDHGPELRWGKIDEIWAAIKDHSKMIGLCNDTGHFIRAGEDPLRACEVFGDRVHAMHVKDFKKDENGHFRDCGLGEGSLNLVALMKWLLARNFKGDLSLEYEGENPVEVCRADLGRIAKAVAAVKA